ncbi:hypothetical protein KAR91_60335 [Candidatus Pacearchaeota archaeon]|nr:hypothetical protein [Candidatus Pacearchaeota archaeon]
MRTKTYELTYYVTRSDKHVCEFCGMALADGILIDKDEIDDQWMVITCLYCERNSLIDI